jgi:hypothetical protein
VILKVISKHSKCVDLASEALDCLQNRKHGAVSSAVRKLELCARLLDDDKLKKWCNFHLGGYSHNLPVQPSELDQDFADLAVSKILELEIPVGKQEILCRLGKSGGGFQSIEVIEK